MVADNFGHDEVQELFRECRIEFRFFRQTAKSRNLLSLALRIRGRHARAGFQSPDLLRKFEPLCKHVNEGGIDIVDAVAKSVQFILSIIHACGSTENPNGL